LKYILIAYYPNLFWCDPDYYPIGSPERELQNALAQFPTISANQEEFSAILAHLDLPDQANYTDEEKLLIYRQHKELTYGLQVTGTGNTYDFTLRIGDGQGYRIIGTITTSGIIKVSTVEVSFNTCPICLARGTLIDTPMGPVPVEELKQGALVWTSDESGQRVEAIILKTSSTIVPDNFQIISIKLNDGRIITASPGHPSAEGKALGDYVAGEILDGGFIISVENVLYTVGVTYDILPSGATGFYWANGVLLGSTLTAN